MPDGTRTLSKIRKVLSTRSCPNGAVLMVEEEPAVSHRRAGGITAFVLILFEEGRVVERRYTSDRERIDTIAEGMIFEHERRKAR
jgi:hypothetical protein